MQEEIGEFSLTDDLKSKKALLADSCDSAAKQYDDYYKSFVGLDSKAQSIATVASIVLASVVAFVNAGQVKTILKCLGGWGYLIILIPPILALGSVILSIVALWVAEVAIPFHALDQMKESADLSRLSSSEFSYEHIQSYYLTRHKQWEESLNDIEKKVSRKGCAVFWGQFFMIVTLLSLLIMFIIIVCVNQ